MNPSPDITSMLGSLLSDPQMLSNVIGMASTLKESGLFDTLLGNLGNTDSEKDDEIIEERSNSDDSGISDRDDPDYTEDRDEKGNSNNDNNNSNNEENRKRSKPQGGFFERNSADRNRIALISALKPYLSREKCEKADMLLTILGILSSMSAFRKRN